MGEFDDSALMQAFGQAGIGIFIAPSVIADEVQREHGVTIIGQTDEVTEQFYAISLERRSDAPCRRRHQRYRPQGTVQGSAPKPSAN